MVSAVVLDANALLMPFQFNMHLDQELTRLFGDIPVFVPSSVIDELSNVRDKHAKAAIALARKYQVIKTSWRGDDAVMQVAKEQNAAVLTNDRELISRLKAENIPIVRLRSGRYLVFKEHGVD